MDKLLEDLLGIEHTAKESLAEIEDERTTQAQRIANEVARRLLEIKRKTEQAVQTLKQDADISTQTELREIESKHRQKAAELQELFDDNAKAWREEWANRILHSRATIATTGSQGGES